MKKSLQQRQQEFLHGGLVYYCKDVKRRCLSEFGTCYYSPSNAENSNSEGCFIGRWLSPELQKELDKGVGLTVDQHGVFNKLPTVLKNLGQNFLYECQKLHDIDEHWCDSGLTSEGEHLVKRIIKDFNLNPDKFKDILNDN